MRRREFILGGLAVALSFPATAQAGWGKGGKPKTTTTTVPTTTTTETTVVIPTTPTLTTPTTDPTYQPPGSLNAKTDFGANNLVGDGETSDSTKLAAIMSSAVSQAKVLWVPPSTYLLAANVAVPSGLTMQGAGPTTLFTATATYPLRLSGSDNVSLSNFAIQGSYTGTQGLIRMDGATDNITLSRLTVYDGGYAGIHNANDGSIAGLRIYDCTVHHCGTFGVHLNNATTVLLERVTTYDFANSLYPAHGFYLTAGNGVTMNDCVANGPLDNTPNGISGYQFVNTLNLTMDNCSAENNKVVGVNDGYGMIFQGTTTATLTNCNAPASNYYGYYKYSLTDNNNVVIGGTNIGTIRVV